MKIKEGEGKKLWGIVMILLIMGVYAANLLLGVLKKATPRTDKEIRIEQYINQLEDEIGDKK